MDYQFVTDEDQRQAVFTRLQQLEAEHMSNVFYLEEARVLNNESEIQKYSTILQGLELRIETYRKKLDSGEQSAE